MKDLPTPGTFLDGILADLTAEKCPFFDAVCAAWPTLFPNVPARPAAWKDGKLFLYVRNAGQLFAFRPKLAAVRRRLAELPGAPVPLKIILEAHQPCSSK